MARSRNIKPGFFTNDDLVELDFATRLLFAGLWTVADKAGRLEDRPKKIKIDVFPSDDVDIEAMLASLTARGFILRYQVDGKAYIQVVNWGKHQNPHHTEKNSVIPPFNGESPVKAPLDAGESPSEHGGNPADSGFIDSLIPDSLIPDSRIPDPTANTLFDPPPAEDGPEPTPAPTPIPTPKPAKPPKAKKEPPKTGEVWAAYAQAYRLRYNAEPVRNLMVNGQMAQIVARLGAEAPAVAAFYLGHQHRFYVDAGHSVGLLLRDAEKLRTQWATNRQVTHTQAAQADRTQANFAAFAPLLAEAKEKAHAES